MELTKPAGVFAQLVGLVLALIGSAVILENLAGGLVILAIGAWLFWEGGKPGRRPRVRKKEDHVSVTGKGGAVEVTEDYIKRARAVLHRAVRQSSPEEIKKHLALAEEIIAKGIADPRVDADRLAKFDSKAEAQRAFARLKKEIGEGA